MSAPNRRKLNHKIDCENPIKIQIKKLEKEIESNNVILSRLNVEAEILKLIKRVKIEDNHRNSSI